MRPSSERVLFTPHAAQMRNAFILSRLKAARDSACGALVEMALDPSEAPSFEQWKTDMVREVVRLVNAERSLANATAAVQADPRIELPEPEAP